MIRDDMHLAAGAHIGVMIIPAALALAECKRWSEAMLLKAIVAGYDMAVALGCAVRAEGCCNQHFRPSGIIGAFGAAATGTVNDKAMSVEAIASALGLAANSATGLNEWAWAGGLEMTTQMGAASRAGITSYDLARQSFSCSKTVLEGPDGLFAAYGCGEHATTVFRDWLATSPVGTGILGARFKPVAGCNFLQTPAMVALAMSNKLQDDLGQVQRIKIFTTTAAKQYPGCDSQGPFQRVQQTKMSLQYAVAAVLMFGSSDESIYYHFSHHRLRTLIGKCHVIVDTLFDQQLAEGRQPCRIEVHISDGGHYVESLPDVPWLDAATVESRFRTEAATMLSVKSVDATVLACQHLPGAERPDVSDILRILQPQKSQRNQL
jgi:2-methylcitrate dehydratase PrpD